ncbi:MAG TPA: hypothetical protein VJB59_04985 [Bdellovibrionota bacterium]|nr:hypothetical protein [Bdellovibrionota bacterium]
MTHFKYSSVKYLPAEPFDEFTPPENRITAAIYINFPQDQTQEQWEESFQNKRAKIICARIRSVPHVTDVDWDQDYIAIRFSDEVCAPDLLPEIRTILRDEEREYDRAEREQTKAEIEKLIASVRAENYEEKLVKGHAVLDARTEKENARHRLNPRFQPGSGIAAGLEVIVDPATVKKRVSEMEARLDKFMLDGGLSLRDVKSVQPNGLYKSVRDVTYRFPYQEFLVIISINWQPSQEPLGNPLPVIFAEVLISEIPEEHSKDFCDLVLRMNKRLSVPVKVAWIYERCFGLVARWHLASIDPIYQDHCLRALLPIATDIYRELNGKFHLPTWKEHCDAKERKPC